MAVKTLMLEIGDARARARTAFDRNWRNWARDLLGDDKPAAALAIGLHPPREGDLSASGRLEHARAWVGQWRGCALPGVEWQRRSWASVGDQSLPVRVLLESPADIALWAGQQGLWDTAVGRVGDIRERLSGTWRNAANAESPQAAADAVRSSIGDWCALDDDDWRTALHVWDWLFAHSGEARYVRQLPIRGIDTKWIERHGKALRALHRALAGRDFAFAQPGKLFRCKACCPETRLGGCDEFALSDAQLALLDPHPGLVVICENLVNALCLHDLPGALAVHGSGFAVTKLAGLAWLADVPVVYWGDLDASGFAILNALRTFAPHARSVMMDTETLHRYFDLCVEEPKPAAGSFENLTPAERKALHLLAEGDPARNIANLRLEQERIEWSWAYDRIVGAIAEALR